MPSAYSASVDVEVLLFDVKSEVDTYSLLPKESAETPGKYDGTFIWNESSFYPFSGITNPGLKIPFDHDSVDVIQSKYFKSGIGASEAFKLKNWKRSLIDGAINLELEHGSAFLFKDNIPIPSNKAAGVIVQGTSIQTVDTVPTTMTTIAFKTQINGNEHFIADIASPEFKTSIQQKWSHVNKFSGVCVSGKQLETFVGAFEYKNLDTTLNEYIIYNLPTYSNEDEYGFKCRKQLPVLSTGLNTLNGFLVDQISSKIIDYDMLVANVDDIAPAIYDMIANPFTRTDIFNVLVTGVPAAAGEFNIDFSNGTLQVYVDIAGGEINFPGTVDFYIDKPSYVIFNQDVNNMTGPHTTFSGPSGLSSQSALYANIILGEKLTLSGQISDGPYNFALANGGVTDIRIFVTDGVTVTEYTTEYMGEEEVPLGEYKLDRFSGILYININEGIPDLDVYVMYNYGPTGHVETSLSNVIKYDDISIVTDLTSNNNGFIVLSQAAKAIDKIEFTILSYGSIEDLDTNSYSVEPDTIFNVKICVKSASGAPVPGVPIDLVVDDGDFEVIFTSGNSDRNGCVFMSVRAPGLTSFMFDIPWYTYEKTTNNNLERKAFYTKGASVVNVLDSLVVDTPPTSCDLVTADLAAGKYVIELEDILNPGSRQFSVKLQYNIVSIDPTGTQITIDGVLPFNSSGDSSRTMFCKARIFNHYYSGAIDVNTVPAPDEITINHEKFRSYMNSAVNGCFIYKTLANEMLSKSEFYINAQNTPELIGGSSIIIEQDAYTPITILSAALATPTTTTITLTAPHGYVDGQAVIIEGSGGTSSYGPLAIAGTLSADSKTITLDVGYTSITPGTLSFTFNGMNWTDTGYGLAVYDNTTPTGYYNAEINYQTGIITIRRSSAIGVTAFTAINFDVAISYNGTYLISNASGADFDIDYIYNADIVPIAAGTAIATDDKFEQLTPVNSTFADGSVVWETTAVHTNTGTPDSVLFSDDGNGLYPFKYVFLTTELQSTAHFSVKDPFSGRIIDSETFTIVSELPTKYYGTFVLSESLLTTGSYIT